ncbi:hypothetical protein KJ839_03930 [Patescibacteria group bacterium]|nr:hypothetical protein [Patescibacteria group bacterium]
MTDYDICINLLSMPSDEELGRLVKERLWKAKCKEYELNGKKYTGSYREIIVGGS